MSLIFTDEGISKEAEYIANGVQYSITEFAVSDQKQASYTGAETAMTNEVYRDTMNADKIVTAIDTDGDKVVEISCTIPLDTTSFNVRELGLFADDGKLIAIGEVSEFEKTSINDNTSTEVTLVVTVKISNTEAVNINITPTTSATPKYVDDSIHDHNVDTSAHPSILSTLGTMQTELDNKTRPGMIMNYAGWSAPTGWLECDGAAINRVTYADLFSVIGTIYGAGDGSTTFNLPDLRGEFVRGLDNSGEKDPGSTGQKSKATIRFTLTAVQGADVIIPAGTRVTPNNDTYFTIYEDVIIPAGNTIGDFIFESEKYESRANGFAIDTITTLVDAGSYPLVQSITNTDASAGGVDSDRDLGSKQNDEFKSHNHDSQYDGRTPSNIDPTGAGSEIGGAGAVYGVNWTYPTTSTGGNETRPRNVALMYIIKT